MDNEEQLEDLESQLSDYDKKIQEVLWNLLKSEKVYQIP